MAGAKHETGVSRSSTLLDVDRAIPQCCTNCPDLEVWAKAGENEWPRVTKRPASLRFEGVRNEKLVIIIGQADAIRECSHCRSYFTQTFQIPEFWWSPWCRRSNGYFGSEKMLDEKGGLESYQTWFRFLVKQMRELQPKPKDQKPYIWFKLNIFTRWIAKNRQTMVIIFDPRPQIRDHLVRFLLETFPASGAYHPYQAHQLFLQELVRLQDDAVWSIRNLVRRAEIQRTSHLAREKNNYFRLHDIARHAIHVSETLEVSIKTLDSMTKEHDQFFVEYPAKDMASRTSQSQSHTHLSFFSNKLQSLLERSLSNKARLLNEIQLSFNILALFKSETSIKIAQAAQTDSATLTTIAVLTLTFLPATFLSAMFSMSFFGFNPDKDRWAMSKDVWIYWAIAAPVTGVTLLAWFYWDRLFPRKAPEEDDE